MLIIALDSKRQAALKLLGAPFPDKPRKLYVFDQEMLLLDKRGCVCIEDVDDATAVYYFLQWLHIQRDTAYKKIRRRNVQRGSFGEP